MKTLTTLAALTAALTVSTPAYADSVANLEALTGSQSDGGATVTEAEADAYADGVTAYSGDDAVRAIVAASRLRGEGAFADDDAYTAVINGLRYRVEGLAISQLRPTDITFNRWTESSPLLVVLDQLGVGYTGVDFVYSWDGWETTHAAAMTPQIGGYCAAWIDGVPLDGRLEYAVHVFGVDGRDFWLNNGRDLGIYGGTFHLNYSMDLASALVSSDETTLGAFGQLVSAFTDPASPGGETVAASELSLLVEQITWEGGPGVEDRRALRPALDALYDLEQAGAAAEGDVIENMRAFVEAQMLPTTTFPGMFFSRGEHGTLIASMSEQPAVSATVVYSTDGWNIAHAVDCTRPSEDEALECDLGHIPPGAYISYTIALHYEDGGETWIRSTLGNFFHPLPLPYGDRT